MSFKIRQGSSLLTSVSAEMYLSKEWLDVKKYIITNALNILANNKRFAYSLYWIHNENGNYELWGYCGSIIELGDI